MSTRPHSHARSAKCLSESELLEALSPSAGNLFTWHVHEGKLRRELKFPDFAHAFGFMAACVSSIEKLDHHPEWFNVYGTLVIDLVTHDAGGITVLDIELAMRMESLAQKLLS